MHRLFGGSLRGNYQHQYNDIGGLHVDLGRDAADVRAMSDPWLHEPLYFDVPEQRGGLAGLPASGGPVGADLPVAKPPKRTPCRTGDRR